MKARLETRGQQADRVLAVPKEFRSLFPTIESEIYNPQGDRSQWKLVNLLATYDLTQLQAMMKRHDMNTYGDYYYGNSAGLAKSLAGKLVQATALEEAWGKLDPFSRKICRWLCRADGSAELSQVRDALNYDNFRMARCLRILESYGLVFDTFSGQEHKIFVGRGIFKVLRKVIGEADQEVVKKQNPPKLVVLQDEPPEIGRASCWVRV